MRGYHCHTSALDPTLFRQPHSHLATDGAGPFIVGAGKPLHIVEGTFDQLKATPQTAN